MRDSTKAETRVLVAWRDRKWRMELILLSSKLTVRMRLITWECMVRPESRVTPRFFADWENWTVVSPTTRESGKETDVDILGEEIIRASVLSSLSLSLLNVIHDLTSRMHSCTDKIRLSSWEGSADFCSWVSSAKEWWVTDLWRFLVSPTTMWKLQVGLAVVG